MTIGLFAICDGENCHKFTMISKTGWELTLVKQGWAIIRTEDKDYTYCSKEKAIEINKEIKGELITREYYEISKEEYNNMFTKKEVNRSDKDV